MTKTEFETFAATATTEAGFAIDPATLVYNNDAQGNFESVRGTVKAVDPKVLGQGLIGKIIAQKSKAPIEDTEVVWDVNGKPKNAPAVLALCTPNK